MSNNRNLAAKNEETRRSLLLRAQYTFGAERIADVVIPTRAIIGLATMPAGADDAQAAYKALTEGGDPTAQELMALELMIRLMRPAPLCKFGRVDDLPSYNQYNQNLMAGWQQFRSAVEPYVYSVGRLDRADDHQSIGTGFLVTTELLVTNQHVLAVLSHGTNVLSPGQALVYFGQEFEPADTHGATPVTTVVAYDEDLDLAILQLGASPAAVSRSPLSIAPGPLAIGANVATIGYPMGGAASNPLFLDKIFGSDLGVKRAAVGQVMKIAPGKLYHDCSTLNGNSGSPLMNLLDAQVVGVHSAGQFMYRNTAIGASALRDFLNPHLRDT